MATKILPSADDTDQIGQSTGNGDDSNLRWKGIFSDVRVEGDLTVAGTTTTVSSTNTTITDTLIELNSGDTGANSDDIGIIMERGTAGDNAAIIWDESADKFVVGTTTATGSSTGDLSVTTGTLVANLDSDSTLTEVKVATELNDSNGNELLAVTATASAVNHLTLANAATNNNPTVTASGDDANVGIDFQLKGTGSFDVHGTSATSAQIKLYEDTDDGSNYIGLKAAAIDTSYTLTLPTDVPASDGLSLVANTDGTCSWNSVSAGGLADNSVGFAKLANIDGFTVIGNVSTAVGTDGDPEEVRIYDEDNMVSDSSTALATQQSIKAYVDNLVPDTATALATSRNIGGVAFDGSADIDLPGVNTSGNQDTSGNAATATALETARTIGGVSFDGTANISLPGVNAAGNQDTSGNAATATALATARTIGGVSFDGTANINLPGVNSSGNQDTSGNAATATALATARTIGGVSFDGTANINLPGVNAAGNQDTSGNAATATALAATVTIGGVNFDGSSSISLPGVNAQGNQDTTGNAATATALATAREIGGVSFDGTADIDLPGVNAQGTQNTTGNAATATALATAREIGGVSFDGTADINLPGVNVQGTQNTTGNAATATALETARTIGGVSFDGTANISLPGVNTSGNQDTTGNASTASALATARSIGGVNFDGTANIVPNTINVADDEATDAARLVLFADATGTQQPKNDGDFTYNPSTGTVSATVLSGSISTSSITLGGTAISATGEEINRLDITTLGTSEASKVVTADASGDITHTGDLTISGSGNGITINSGDLNVTGGAQISGSLQVNDKLNLAGSVATIGATTLKMDDSLIELNYLGSNASGTRDLGIFGRTIDDTNDTYQGLVFDGSDSLWKFINTQTYPGADNYVSNTSNSKLQVDTVIVKKSAPAASTGADGDVAGMIAYDSSYIYICHTDYDGSTHIWKRVALSSDTWS